MTGSWLTTADHKRLGRMYIATAFAFLLLNGLAGLVLRAADLSDASYLRLSDLHATSTAVLVLGPLFVGLATYLVPLQIGAARLAFPRLQAFAFWAYALGGATHLLTYTGDGPRLAGLGFGQFTLSGGGDKAHTDLWIATLAVVTIAAILAAVNLFATVLVQRTEGLTLGRIPMFSWATFVASAGTVLAAPVFLGGLLLLFLDQHFGGHDFFASGTVGTQVIWQHTLWLYGRPDIYLLLVPGLGLACDMVAKAARRPLANENAARGALVAVGFFGFGSWAAGTKVADAIVLPTYSPLTAAVLLPIGALILLWLDTLRRAGKPKVDIGLAFVVGFILAIGGAVLAAAISAVESVDGSAWSSGQIHLVASVAPLLLAVGALHHWAPKLSGRTANAGAGGLQLLLLLGGGALLALGSYLAGWDGQPRGVTFENDSLGLLTAAGGAVFMLGVLFVAVTVVLPLLKPAAATDDASDGLTLEWATTSPPPPYNFDSMPEVRSSTPLADLEPAEVGS